MSRLTTVDVSHNTKLTYLNLTRNYLTSIAVSQAAHEVVVLDGLLGLLDTGVAGAEGIA
jgi:hypothetical protein